MTAILPPSFLSPAVRCRVSESPIMAWPVGFTRFILFFRSPENSGFSEEYLIHEALSLPEIDGALGGLIAARRPLLPATYTLDYVRVNYPHDSRTLLPYTGTPPVPCAGTFSAVSPERVEVGALVTFFTVSGRVAKRIFRGVGEDSVADDGTIVLGTDWTDALGAFCDYLTGGSFGLINPKETSSTPPIPAYTFAAYTAFQLRRSTTRDTGRPFGLRRGRSAA